MTSWQVTLVGIVPCFHVCISLNVTVIAVICLTRYSNHKSSFRDPNKRLSAELSKHIWDLKDAKIGFTLTWKILKQAAQFNPASNRCYLCPWEKYFIVCRADLASLNKQNELVTSCRQARKFLLSSFTSSVGTQ